MKDVDAAGGLNGLLAHQLAVRPGGPAITDSGRSLDWQSFEHLVGQFAAFLDGQGVRAASRVALWMPNSIDYAAAIFAVARCGAIAVHVNTRFGVAEVADIVSRSRAELIVTSDGFGTVDFMGMLDRIAPEALSGVRAIISTTGSARDAVHGIPVVALALGSTKADGSDADDLCLTFTTSGTTSKPKLVAHRQRSAAQHGIDVARFTDMMAEGSCYLATAPFCGTYGNVGLMAATASGAHVICTDVFDPEVAGALIRTHRVTHMLGDDRLVGRLAEVALAGPGPFDSIRFCATAMFNPDAAKSVALAVEAGICPCALYGSSEVHAVFAVGDVANKGYGDIRPVSPHGEFKVAPVDGDTASPDGRGTLLIRSQTMFVEYLDNPGATAASRSADGWFNTGDLIEDHGDTFLFEGRLGDVLRLGGFLVNPMEIENHLQLHPGVERAQIVGVDVDGRAGAFAFVTARGGASLDEAELLAHCRRDLARYKVPVRAVQVDDFPTTAGPNGLKISRAQMRDMAGAILRDAAVPAAG